MLLITMDNLWFPCWISIWKDTSQPIFHFLADSVWFNDEAIVVLQQFTVVVARSLNIKNNPRLLNRSTVVASPWWACSALSASLQVPICNYQHFILPLHVLYIVRRYTTDLHGARRDRYAFSIALQKTFTFKSKTRFLVTLKTWESPLPSPTPSSSCSQLIDDGDCPPLVPLPCLPHGCHWALYTVFAGSIHSFLIGTEITGLVLQAPRSQQGGRGTL